MSETKKTITAAVLVIGDEILSGRTKDKNIGFIADFCTNVGIELAEVRIVPDIEVKLPLDVMHVTPNPERGMTAEQVKSSGDVQLLRAVEELTQPGS